MTSSVWEWNAVGEPSIQVMPGFEATPVRPTDIDTWIQLEHNWDEASPEERETIREEAISGLQRTVERQKVFIDQFRKGEPVSGAGSWMVRDKANDGLAVCRIHFNPPLPGQDVDPNSRNVGWHTLPSYRRRGIAKAAAKVIFEEYAGKVMKLHYLTSETRADNHPSISLLQSVGFEKTGETPATWDDFRVELRGPETLMIAEFKKVLNPE